MLSGPVGLEPQCQVPQPLGFWLYGPKPKGPQCLIGETCLTSAAGGWPNLTEGTPNRVQIVWTTGWVKWSLVISLPTYQKLLTLWWVPWQLLQKAVFDTFTFDWWWGIQKPLSRMDPKNKWLLVVFLISALLYGQFPFPFPCLIRCQSN